jgi:imidazolonepropionase-like amidohydrolase
MTHKIIGSVGILLATLLAFAQPALAQEEQVHQTLFTNVHVFDGTSEKLAMAQDVLVEGNLIKKIGKGLVAANGATVIDGGGRTLMPGIIEAHGHVAIGMNLDRLSEEDPMYVAAKAAAAARFYLDHGWTTVRDVGGSSFGIKKAVDEGLTPGPRVHPAGLAISQTSGHGDFRRFADPHPNSLREPYVINRVLSTVADGVPEVLRATREELRKGAVHIKVLAGGGLSSQFDPLTQPDTPWRR